MQTGKGASFITHIAIGIKHRRFKKKNNEIDVYEFVVQCPKVN